MFRQVQGTFQYYHQFTVRTDSLKTFCDCMEIRYSISKCYSCHWNQMRFISPNCKVDLNITSQLKVNAKIFCLGFSATVNFSLFLAQIVFSRLHVKRPQVLPLKMKLCFSSQGLLSNQMQCFCKVIWKQNWKIFTRDVWRLKNYSITVYLILCFTVQYILRWSFHLSI